MFSRLKFEIKPLVNEMLDQLPTEVWESNSTTFLDPAMAGGQFVKEVITRLRKYKHSDENIKNRVYGCSDHKRNMKFAIQKHNLIGTFEACDVSEKEWNMKFDVVVGNPPYQHQENKNFYREFIDLAMKISDVRALIVPSAFFTPSKFKQYKISQYRYIGNPFLGVKLSMASFISIDGTHNTVFTDGVTSVTLNHTEITSTPGEDIIMWRDNRMLIADSENGLMFESGSLKRREAVKYQGNDIKCILSTGGTKKFDIAWLNDAAKSKIGGLGEHKVVFGADYSLKKIGPVKYAAPDLGCSARVYYIKCQDKEEAMFLIEYFNSVAISTLVESIKTRTAKNSKTIISMIPDPRKYQTNVK